MSPSELGERAVALGTQILAPLVLGDALLPIRPIGLEMALEIGVERRLEDDQQRSAVNAARLRRARALCALDALPELDPSEWAMAAALNDLLQVTNEELSSFATRGRHGTLLAATRRLCDSIAPPADLGQALCRHATFGRLLELKRTDTRVSWWTGSATFRGRAVPGRLQCWPRLRRVDVQTETVALCEMATSLPIDQGDYIGTIGALLRCSPLTDLATVARQSPAFVWSPSTLGLVATHAGCNLALRAFARREPSAALWTRKVAELGAAGLRAMEQAAATLPAGAGHNMALGFTQVFREAVASWTAEAAA